MNCETEHSPKPLGDPVRHFWLMQDMARAAGIDLVEQVKRGRVTTDGWADMVQRCRGCDWERGGGCSRWLELLTPDEAVVVPRACENAETLNAMRVPGE